MLSKKIIWTFAGVLSLMALATSVLQAQTAAKRLLLLNSSGEAVEYGLGTAGAAPMTTIVIQPGETRTLFPVPDRDVLYFHYDGSGAWAAPYPIRFFPDPVYKWKFVPSGSTPGLVGAPEIP